MAAIATQETVNAAAAALAASGQKPTIDRIISSLGGGSASTVTRLLSVWKDEQRAARASKPQPQPEPAALAPGALVPTEMLAGVSAAIDSVQTAVFAACESLVARERSRADQQLAALKEGHQRQLDQIIASRDAALADLEDELKESKKETTLCIVEGAEIEEKLEDAEAALAESSAALTAAHQQIEIQRDRADRAELKADALHSRIESLIAELATARATAPAKPAGDFCLTPPPDDEPAGPSKPARKGK